MIIIATLLSAFYSVSVLAQAPDYFKNSYEESQQHFDELYTRAKNTNPKAEVLDYQYSEGTIKSYFFPPVEKAENLLILISGTHGIEAFTGSAVQRYLLDQKLNLKKTAVLMVHGMNLYGFKNFRRVNENNIDLNRNFVLDRSSFQSDDAHYGLLNDFLNPANPPRTGFFQHAIFIGKAVMNIVRHSIEALRSSILKGQYSFPKGIFYGGDRIQPQAGLIEALIEEYVSASYKKIMLIDLHTGYGERGRLHLLAGKTADPNSRELARIFGEDSIDFADKKNFYAVQGEMLTYFITKIKKKTASETVGVTFEYGTLDSQKTLGSIESLRRVILENQNFHHPAEEVDAKNIQHLYREMFYPSDLKWREQVIKQTDEKMTKALSYLEN